MGKPATYGLTSVDTHVLQQPKLSVIGDEDGLGAR